MKKQSTFTLVAALLATTFTLSGAFANAQARPSTRTASRPAAARPVVRTAAPVVVVAATPTPPPATPTPPPIAQFDDVHPYQTQSILRQADGTILVIPAMASDYKIFVPGKTEPVVYPKTALIYEKRNPLPELQVMGGTYAFFKGNYLATVSADGFFTYKGKVNFEPAVVGGNYFTKKGSNEIVVIDSYGYYIETGVIAPSIRLAGGNYFIDADGSLTTIKSVGSAPGQSLGLVTKKLGWNFSDAIVAGGNYFMKQDGSLITIDSKTGFFSEKAFTPESRPSLVGGNYFIGTDNAVYTVSSEGIVFKTITLTSRPSTLGYSYMKFDDGTFALVTANGGLHTEAVRVGAAGKAEYTTKIPAALESNSAYTPNSHRN